MSEDKTGPHEPWLLMPKAMVDHFRILRPVGRGGMGEVYLARDTKLGRKVALKIVKPDALGSRLAVERFLFEARATARFSHPHIVTIFAAGEDQGRPYVALEYLEGRSLRERLMLERPSLAEILRTTIAVADALAAAHAENILHRDLKPDNVVMATDGRLRVVDFGLARTFVRQEGIDTTRVGRPSAAEAGPLPETDSESEGGLIHGTPPYMAPEQWTDQKLTGAVDVWALGVLLYQMLGGQRPFEGNTTRELARQVCSPEPVPALPDDRGIPVELTELVTACLHKYPGQRPTAAEVRDRLRLLTGGQRSSTPAAEENPFRGLLPFGEQHQHLFFARAAEVAASHERLRNEPLLVVLGTSGAGKSSFVQAGLIPRLRERGALYLIQLRPGRDPFLALARRLAEVDQPTVEQTPLPALGDPMDGETEELSIGGAFRVRAQQLATELRTAPRTLNLRLQEIADNHGCRVLLFIDQLEELHTLVESESLRRAFMQAICHAADDAEAPVRAIFTLREEFLSQLSVDRGVREAMRNVLVLRRPAAEALRDTLANPVEAVGYSFSDDDLIRDMVEEVQGEAACLPLLQFAGQILWERRDRTENLLTRSAYEEIGGVAGALAQHADGVLSGLTRSERELARALLLRLVTADGNRQAVERSRLLGGLEPAAEGVLKRLVEARLLTGKQASGGESDLGSSEAELELVHESLILTWGRLARWIDESREELVFLTEVNQAAALWAKRGHRDDELWQGDALHEAWQAAEHCTTKLSDPVRRFLQAGRKRERRRRMRLRASVVAAFVLLACVALAFAFKERETRGEKERAEHQWAVAQREAAAAALVRGQPYEARAKLRGAFELEDSPAARGLWDELTQEPLIVEQIFSAGINSVEFSPDDRAIAVALRDDTVHVIDVETMASRVLRGCDGDVVQAIFTPDGRELALGCDPAGVRLLDRHSGRRRTEITFDAPFLMALDLDPSGRTLAAAGDDREVRFIDVLTGQMRDTLPVPGDLHSIAYSPDGRLLAAGGETGPVWLWSIDGGELNLEHTFRGHTDSVRSVAFNADSMRLVSGSVDGSVRVWNTENGRQVTLLAEHLDRVYNAVYHPRQDVIAVTGADRMVRVWERPDPASQILLSGHTSRVFGLAFSSAGDLLASGGVDNRLRIYQVATARQEKPKVERAGPITSAAVSSRGATLATTQNDGIIQLWDVASGERRQRLQGHNGEAFTAIFHPKGKLLASAGWDKTVRLWDLSSGAQLRVLDGHSLWVDCFAFSRDGSLLASGSGDRTVRLWQMPSGRQVSVLRGHSATVTDVAFNRRGNLLASVALDGTVRIWQVDRGKLLHVLEGLEPSLAAFSPDGQQIAVIDQRSVYFFDVASGGLGEVKAGPPGFEPVALAWDRSGPVAGVTAPGKRPRIWSPTTGKTKTLEGRGLEVKDLTLDLDNDVVVAVDVDDSVRLWHLTTGRLIWRATLLAVAKDAPVALLTHRGWVKVQDGEVAIPTATGWRAAARDAIMGSLATASDLLCLGRPSGEVELWDVETDERRRRETVGELSDLVATPDGCLALVEGTAFFVPWSGQVRSLVSGTSAIVCEGGAILLAVGPEVRVLAANGAVLASYPARSGIAALLHVGPWLVLGYPDGQIEVSSTGTGVLTPGVSLQETPSSAPVRMRPGPTGTVIIGFEDGHVGLWELETGARFRAAQLHGTVVHLEVGERELYAATDLGDHLTWDLSVFNNDYCHLMSTIWQQVPVRWKGGRAVIASPPTDHRCWAQRSF